MGHGRESLAHFFLPQGVIQPDLRPLPEIISVNYYKESTMTLKERISEDIKTAMKGGEKGRVGCLRLLMAAIKNKEIEKIPREDLSDEGIQSLIGTLIRQRRDSIELYRKGNRSELADAEESEIKILTEYLPAQLTPEEILAIVRETAEAEGLSGMSSMGALMKAVMPKVKGKAGGNAVQGAAKEVLQG